MIDVEEEPSLKVMESLAEKPKEENEMPVEQPDDSTA